MQATINLERIEEHHSFINKKQTGFRSGWCTKHIHTVQIIVKQCAPPALHRFRLSFDTVNREWYALRRRSFPEKLTAIITAAYDDAKCHILHQGEISKKFYVQSRAHQSCILSPILFPSRYWWGNKKTSSVYRPDTRGGVDQKVQMAVDGHILRRDDKSIVGYAMQWYPLFQDCHLEVKNDVKISLYSSKNYIDKKLIKFKLFPSYNACAQIIWKCCDLRPIFSRHRSYSAEITDMRM